MRIAISTDGEFVSAHFGRCPLFTIIDIENGKVKKMKTVDNPGHQPGLIPNFLHESSVNCIIAGGMGMRAAELFNELGIETIVGVSGKIEDVLKDLEKGTLEGGQSLCSPGSGKGYGVEKTVCDHPDEKDHEE